MPRSHIRDINLFISHLLVWIISIIGVDELFGLIISNPTGYGMKQGNDHRRCANNHFVLMPRPSRCARALCMNRSFNNGRPGSRVRLCYGCQAAAYCSMECQRRDWQDHKHRCSGMW